MTPEQDSPGEDQEPPEQELKSSTQFIYSILSRARRAVLGAPRDIQDPGVFHRISLIAFLAWVGLGADGLSSSAYGPDEAFRALGEHTYLAVALALATAFTVFIISYAYSRIIEHFPSGGGGYVVASKLLGPKYGVVSGSALLVDYVLTISVSVASGVDQVFSVLPPSWHQHKFVVVATIILMLMVMNLRGVKESIKLLLPIFITFIITHGIVIVGGFATHAADAARVAQDVSAGYSSGLVTIGTAGMLALFFRAYSMGAGTYTGIEAVSNGLQIMREPRVETAKRTMVYMAVSLAVTAGGILLLYLFFKAAPETGKTMNAVLIDRFAGGWRFGSFNVGSTFVVITLASEAALLFVAAQTGFIDGPRIMSNMATDSWLPHRFRSFSDRLTMQNGVLLISGAAILTLAVTDGNTSTLVLMYSINVFLTFSLSQMGMVRYWIRHRRKYPDWTRHIIIHIIGLVLCVAILAVNMVEKFSEGGWITIGITTLLILTCLLIQRHYRRVRGHLRRLDTILSDLPDVPGATPQPIQPGAPTAVLLVDQFGGLGIHSFLSIHRLFPNHFKNFIFISVNVVDAGNLKGSEDFAKSEESTREALQQYVDLAKRFGFAADYRMATGIEVLDEGEELCRQIAKEYPRSLFFLGKLVFEKERWYHRVLHSETALQMQRRLQFDGLNSMVLPIRVYAGMAPA